MRAPVGRAAALAGRACPPLARPAPPPRPPATRPRPAPPRPPTGRPRGRADVHVAAASDVPGGVGAGEAGEWDAVRASHKAGDLLALRKDELTAYARAHGLKVSGNKSDLAARIGPHLDGGGGMATGKAGGNPPRQGGGGTAAKGAGGRLRPRVPPVMPPPPPMPRAPPPPASSPRPLRLLSWNVNGLRALLKKEGDPLGSLLEREKPDVLCLQETKIQGKHVKEVEGALGELGWVAQHGPRMAWSCSTARLGYSGTAVLSRAPCEFSYGVGDPSLDEEGRVITADFEGFYLVTVYTPNSGQELARLGYRTLEWDRAFERHVASLQARKPVVVTGDLNVARTPIDLHAPKTSEGLSGYTKEERASFEGLLGRTGLVDTFRLRHGDVTHAYSYWGFRGGLRAKNKGWRIDYFLADPALTPHVHDAFILGDVLGSDHCPVGMDLIPPA